MYREPDRTPECAVCGRTALSPLTRLDPTKGFLGVRYKRKNDQHNCVVQRARVCLECGHVMLFVDSRTLAELKAALPDLSPIGVD